MLVTLYPRKTDGYYVSTICTKYTYAINDMVYNYSDNSNIRRHYDHNNCILDERFAVYEGGGGFKRRVLRMEEKTWLLYWTCNDDEYCVILVLLVFNKNKNKNLNYAYKTLVSCKHSTSLNIIFHLQIEFHFMSCICIVKNDCSMLLSRRFFFFLPRFQLSQAHKFQLENYVI